MQPVRSTDPFQNHHKEASDHDSIVGQQASSAQGTKSLETKVSSRRITAQRMVGASVAEESIEQQAQVLPDDVLQQVAEIEAHCATKAVKAVAPKRRRKRTAAAVWTNGALCLQAVELSRPAPIAEKAKQFREESLYGGRIRRMTGETLLHGGRAQRNSEATTVPNVSPSHHLATDDKNALKLHCPEDCQMVYGVYKWLLISSAGYILCMS